MLKLPAFIYGTTRLGDDSIPFETRVEIAQKAMSLTPFFHTSNQYGDALTVLKEAFSRQPAQIPSTIVKVGWSSASEIREQILTQATAMGLEKITVGQLCLGGELAESFANNGPEIDELLALKLEGIVDHFVLEVFPWTTENPLRALRAGHALRLVDAYIFYFNPLQRFVLNDLWDEIVTQQLPIVAMRTVAGGSLDRLLQSDCNSPSWLIDRAREIAPIAARVNTSSWTEFCLRFAASFPFVLGTVGSTSSATNLEQFKYAFDPAEPLPADVIADILECQRRWSEEVDAHAEPWTM